MSGYGSRGSQLVKKVVGFGVALPVVIFLRMTVLDVDEGGVRVGTEMEAYASEYLGANSLLKPGEQVIAYYDYTVLLDGTEAAVLTDQRVFHYLEGRITNEVPVSSITSIEDYDADLGIRYIVVEGRRGDVVAIEIAPFNGADKFVRALRETWNDVESRGRR